MDIFDHKILRALKKNARLSNQELSEQIGLSPSPCLRRVRALEKKKIITGYTVCVNHEAIGLDVMAFVTVRLTAQNNDIMENFEREVSKIDEVIACYLMSGQQDYTLQILSPSLKTYEQFIRHKLTKISGVGSLETYFVFGKVKGQFI